MIKAFIIDDEQDAITALQLMLGKFFTDVVVCGVASSVDSAIELIRTEQPQVLFLDVEMNGETGFDLLFRLNYEHMVVVFITAHDQYAIQALKKGARDYLLKPVDPDELAQALEKVRKELNRQKKLDTLAEETYIYVNTGTMTELLKRDEVLYIKGDGRYSELYCTDNRKLVMCRNIGEFESELVGAGFFRVHKSALVNLAHISKLKKGRENYVEMNNGTLLPISRRKKSEFMSIMSTWV